jgi:uncharacterized protein YcbX
MHLADIVIYPVKALRGRTAEAATVEPCGLAGDRRWMVVDPSGRFITQRTHPMMALIEATPIDAGLRLSAPGRTPLTVAVPDGAAPLVDVTVWRDTIPARLADSAASALLQAALGTPCRLVWLHDPASRVADPAYAPAGSVVSLADGFPVLLTTIASLDALNHWLPAPVTIARFRPNLVVEGAAAWDEDRWRRIRIGEATFRVVKPCERCIVTTVDPETGKRPDRTEPLRTLGRIRQDARGGVLFGQNLVPQSGGVIRVGDRVEILEAGAPNVELVAP